MGTSTLKEAASSLYDILEPLSEDERLRAINSALLLLGQSPSVKGSPVSGKSTDGGSGDAPGDIEGLGPKARRWTSQNGITGEMLEECFHLDADPPEVVADVPGKPTKTKVLNCYLLTGAAFLLKNDDPSFEDSVARNVCEHVGCLDTTNHAKYTKFGNRISGDKKKGWKLLAPGLREAAELVKSISSSDND